MSLFAAVGIVCAEGKGNDLHVRLVVPIPWARAEGLSPNAHTTPQKSKFNAFELRVSKMST